MSRSRVIFTTLNFYIFSGTYYVQNPAYMLSYFIKDLREPTEKYTDKPGQEQI